MRLKERLEALARMAARRPRTALAVTVALALIGGVLALGLQPSAATSTFVSSSSASYGATQADYRHFGGDAIVVLIREPLTDLLETADLGRLSQLEGCLAGERMVLDSSHTAYVAAPASTTPIGGTDGPCGRLARAHAVQVVYGPATFLSRSAAAVNQGIAQLEGSVTAAERASGQQAYEQAIAAHDSSAQASKLAQSAAQSTYENELNQLEMTAEQTGLSLSDLPASITNDDFINSVVFDDSRGVNAPKGRFAYLFPTADSALVQVRLRSNLSTARQAQIISLVRRAVGLPEFALQYSGTYTVSGEPVVVSDLTAQITHSIVVLLIAALLVMALVLLLVFRARTARRRGGALRLLPLGVALLAAGITFGIVALAGATLTLASIAVLPILIGLAVDYAIQFQSRVHEAQADGAGPEAAVVRAAGAGGPTIAVAALATGVGFLVLLLSPVPMVRGFGLLIVLGIAIALACALTAGSAAQVLLLGGGRRGPRHLAPADPNRRRLPFAAVLAPSLRGAREIGSDVSVRVRRAGRRLAVQRSAVSRLAVPRPVVPRLARRRPAEGRSGARRLARPRFAPRGSVIGEVVRRPGTVLAIGVVLAVLGWVADTQTSVQSDITKLVPSGMPALRDLHRLERVTGTSGELDVTVHAHDVATAGVLDWMITYENRLLTHFGYQEHQGCQRATLCPALSLPDLFSQGTSTSSTSSTSSTQSGAGALTDVEIKALLTAIPGYFKQAVITSDDRNAVLAFGIRLMPLSRQERVIDYMRSQLHPPAGVSAQLAGLPVLAAEANQALSSSARRLLTLLAGLFAVGIVLLAAFRSWRRALIPVVPIALATGWSALILFLIGVPLNPMSATLGSLVIAISTEFSVLLSERFGQERRASGELLVAIRSAYRSTGRAVLASGVTAIAGFGVLAFSNITMLRDFGLVTLVDLTVSLLGVLLVLPAVLAVAERGGLVSRRGGLARHVRAFPRPRRRARVA